MLLIKTETVYLQYQHVHTALFSDRNWEHQSMISSMDEVTILKFKTTQNKTGYCFPAAPDQM